MKSFKFLSVCRELKYFVLLILGKSQSFKSRLAISHHENARSKRRYCWVQQGRGLFWFSHCLLSHLFCMIHPFFSQSSPRSVFTISSVIRPRPQQPMIRQHFSTRNADQHQLTPTERFHSTSADFAKRQSLHQISKVLPPGAKIWI